MQTERPQLTREESRANVSACRLRKVLDTVKYGRRERTTRRKLPAIASLRLEAAKDDSGEEKTKLYLAYGSNLCHETFQGKRGIRPLASLNVVVPTLRMTFDLPGIPYVEPCFANSATRDPTLPPSKPEYASNDYHKDRWKKGMVGVVYEVTPDDYAHIIATEGGGASYKDVMVECFPLAVEGGEVPELPSTGAFMSHTLFAPAVPPDDPEHHGGRFSRPDPSYAQASARYLKLITDGAEEHTLPQEYRDYLHNLRPYEARGAKTRMGAFVFQLIWLPFITMLFGLMQQYQDENGNVPSWVAKLGAIIFGAVWTSYDGIFKPIFGDGERTDYSKKPNDDRRRNKNRKGDEQSQVLLPTHESWPEKAQY